MDVRLEKTGERELPWVKKVFREAFPPEERPPFFLLKRRMKTGEGLCLTAWDGGAPVGFLYLICHGDMAYLFFFALEKGRRGKGYGTEILRLLRERYRGKRLFLARERLDRQAPNYDQRVRRHTFYLRAGFEDQPCVIQEGGVTYDVMSIGGGISPEEYDALISPWAGRWVRRFIPMRLEARP